MLTLPYIEGWKKVRGFSEKKIVKEHVIEEREIKDESGARRELVDKRRKDFKKKEGVKESDSGNLKGKRRREENIIVAGVEKKIKVEQEAHKERKRPPVEDNIKKLSNKTDKNKKTEEERIKQEILMRH